MNLTLNDQQKRIQTLAREFAEKNVKPGAIERDETSTYDVSLFNKMGSLGFIGLPYPEALGGQGMGYLEYALAVEEISKIDASLGISFSVATSLYCGTIFNSSAPENIKKKFMEPVLSGKHLGGFGLTEHSAGSDAAGQTTIATKDGDSYIINGAKCFNTNGPLADYYVIYCLTDPSIGTKSMTCFAVPRSTPGVSIGHIENKMGIRSAQVSDIVLDNVRVPAEYMLAQPGEGFKLAMKTLDCGRIGVAAQGLGIAEGAFEIARKYMMEREQFGKSLNKQQYLAFKMAELYTKIEAARLLVYRAALVHDEGGRFSVDAAMAKMTATDVAMEVTTEAVQMLGGNGYMREYEVERMMRDAKITQIYEGTNEIQRLVISGQIFR
ncbi:acyl-CoA dehydrogenase family protein [Clostridium minihomine]|uniref:acyl-CoA dehydrogenase family protein n=1 Tax=Clostridium minihomine TaxID=2045012 RepID=UPI000C770F06|nr:acyl-CoA dehydrogenase family protein [Clostridium minihomine]